MTHSVEFVGIDSLPRTRSGVGKAELAVHWLRSDARARFANTPEGIAALLGQLAAEDAPVAVVFEATGGCEHGLWRALAEAGLDARQLCPRRVRRFAQARGRLYKTDAADARTLAEYAAHFPGEGRTWPGDAVAELGQLVLRRRTLVAMRKAVRTRRPQTRLAALARLDDELEAILDGHIVEVEALVAAAIESDAALAERARLLRSIPGAGPVLAAMLIARMPELGQMSAREAAALAGLAPMADDSGKHHGERHIAGGRREVRAVLFEAALTAMRCNPEIAAFVARLRAEGKKHKQVVIAAARKLVVLANAVLKRGTPWHPA